MAQKLSVRRPGHVVSNIGRSFSAQPNADSSSTAAPMTFCRVTLPDGSVRTFPFRDSSTAGDLKRLVIRRICTETCGTVETAKLRKLEKEYRTYAICYTDPVTNKVMPLRDYATSQDVAGQNQPLFDFYETVLNDTLEGMGLPASVRAEFMTTVFEHSAFRSRVVGGGMQVPSKSEYAMIRGMYDLCSKFLEMQEEEQAAARIQALWRGYRWRKHGLKRVKENYNKTHVENFWVILKMESEYLKKIQSLTESISNPILSSTDPKLKEQTKDLAELLIALRAIESLHRQLGRKLRWFVEEGCDWPRVAKFGKLYEDMAQEFHVYGPYIRNFQFVVGVLERTMVEGTERPRLRQFLEERLEEEGLDLQSEMTKPLNHLGQIESLLNGMVQGMDWEHPDFRPMKMAADIMHEANKYIVTSMEQAGDIAKVKEIESRLVMGKKVTDGPEMTYMKQINTAQHKKTGKVVVWKTPTKAKKEHGLLVIFDSMALVLVKSGKGGGNQLKVRACFTTEEHPMKVEETPDSAFQIMYISGPEDPSEIPGSKVKFQLENPMEGREFFELLRALSSNTGVFGADFTELLKRENSDMEVPIVIRKAYEWIDAHSLEEEGLFRIPGSAQVEKALVQAADKGGAASLDLENWPSINCHDVAGLIKLYFRELPVPLCGPLFVDLIAAHKELGEDIPRYVERLKSIFARLPSPNLTTFKYVVRGMYRISERREMVLQLPIANEVLGVIIENTKDIFPEE